MKYIISTLCLSLLALTITAQNFGEIQGKVLDENGEGIPGVNVTTQAVSGDVGAVTDVFGKFKIKPLVAGTYDLEFSSMGLQSINRKGVKVDPNKIRFIDDVIMAEGAEGLGEVLVEIETVPLIDPEETGLITKRFEEIQQSPLAKTPMKYIATMVPGASQGANGELYFRGSRQGAVQYHIDGVKLTQNTLNMPSAAIGSISVYTGGIPAKYGDTNGGVVVIETRSYMDLYYADLYSND